MREKMRSPDFDWSNSGSSLTLIKDGNKYNGVLVCDDEGFNGDDEYPIWTVELIDGPSKPLYWFDHWDYAWTTNIMHNPPPNERLVLIKCDDWSGEYTMVAMRQDYKKPVKGKSKKGFKQGWRWIGPNGNTLTRKELPSAWKYL